MLPPGIQSALRRSAIMLPVTVLACLWGCTASAGGAGDRPTSDGGVNVTVPALSAQALGSESAGRSWSIPPPPGTGSADGQMAVILWDELKRVRTPAGLQTDNGISMINGSRQ